MTTHRRKTPRLDELPPLPIAPVQRKHSGIVAHQMGMVGQHSARQEPVDISDEGVITKDVKRRHIRLDLIDENPYAPREVYTPEMLLARANSIRAHGQHDAIHVIPHPDDPDRFMIADGWTRVQSCLIHDVCETLRADIHLKLTPKEAAWFGYEQNESREAHCDLDRCMFFQKQLADGASEKEVQDRAGVKKTTFGWMKSFAQLDTEVLDLIRNCENPAMFSAKIADYIYRIQAHLGVAEAVAFAGKFKTGNFTHAQFIERVQKRLDGVRKPPASRSTGKTLRYDNGTFRTKGNNVVLNLKLKSEVMSQFTAEMEQLLDKYTVKEQESATAQDTQSEK